MLQSGRGKGADMLTLGNHPNDRSLLSYYELSIPCATSLGHFLYSSPPTFLLIILSFSISFNSLIPTHTLLFLHCLHPEESGNQ